MKIKANAKINLTLDITGVREDGFHTLSSVMAPISLCDEIVIEKSDKLSFDCNISSICDDKNLCVRAAKLFFESLNTDERASIYLEKNIPFPAGLGGGSADAAAVLRGLNSLFGNILDEKILYSLAERLGSDVPLCLYNKPALCEGRGEILTPLNRMPTLDVVIAIGKARLSTPEVYFEYDKASLPIKDDTSNLLKALESRNRDEIIKAFGNAFEPITDILAPETKQLREKMLELGAKNSRLSGSGPSVYGVFDSAENAKKAAKALENMGYFAVYCQTL